MTKKLNARVSSWIIGIIVVFLLLALLYKIHNYTGVRSSPKYVPQQAQFHGIDVALEFFNSEFNGYPPSEGLDPNDIPYCGTMKLAEAMAGQDLLGFHPNSIFNSNGTDPNGILIYDTSTMSLRKGPYLPIENANIYHVKEIFKDTGVFNGTENIICDIFIQKLPTGKKAGMPILYYKADTSKSSNDINNPDNPDNIYNYKDNYDLLALGVSGKPGVKHPLYEDPSLFYIMTQNYKVTSTSMPFNKDTYILISAGPDGLFGTSDDITNFDFKLRPKELATENTTEGAIGKETHSKND